MTRTTGFFRLMRPANIVTSIADVLAGIAISGLLAESYFEINYLLPVFLLIISTIGLYGGGIVFNDVFDAALDKVERPERPIPSGAVSIREAVVLGSLLLVIGVTAALVYSVVSGTIAFCIAASALIYDKWGKHHSLLGPLNMGLCRGLNLLLGISIFPAALNNWWGLAIVPIVYIASITMISRGEVHGGSRVTLYTACLLYSLVIGCIFYFSFAKDRELITVLILVSFGWMIFKPLLEAIHEPVGRNIGKAVKAGVIALILMNAAWAAAFGSTYLAMIILLLLPLSIWLGKKFAVT
ncbi:MAG: UbiA-like protein EboC [Chitinophagaceae bacterium]